MRVSLIVPALDEAAIIGPLVARVPRAVVGDVIVVDNGSSDDTGRLAAEAGARVVREPRRGYGAACWAGVMALDPDTEAAVFLDADGSQRPEEIPLVLEPIATSRADFVMGSRRLAGGHPIHASLGTRAVAAYVSWRFGVRLTDVGPLRAIQIGLLRRLSMRDRSSGWPVEMVVKVAALGGRIVEVPVSHGPRLAGRSKVSGTVMGSLRAGYGFLSAAIRAAGDIR